MHRARNASGPQYIEPAMRRAQRLYLQALDEGGIE